MGKVKAAFFDIDGTLLSHSTNRIPLSAFRSLAKLHERGTLLFVATGRHMLEMESVRGLLDLPWDGFITLDGQYCRDRQEVYFSNELDPEDVASLVRHTARMEIPCMFVEEDRMYLSRMSGRVREVQKAIHVPPVPVEDLARGLEHPVYLAATYCLPEEQEQLMRELRSSRSARWNPYAYDIFHAGGGKDVGFLKTCGRFGIAPEETIAFGDSENDIELLRSAGTGVALGNADQAVKDVCDLVTADIDEDGIEQALRRLGMLGA